jgi:hypothetical protein
MAHIRAWKRINGVKNEAPEIKAGESLLHFGVKPIRKLPILFNRCGYLIDEVLLLIAKFLAIHVAPLKPEPLKSCQEIRCTLESVIQRFFGANLLRGWRVQLG